MQQTSTSPTTMTSSNIIFFCLLITVFYFISQSTSSSSPLAYLPRRQPLRELMIISSPNQQDMYQKTKVNRGGKRSTNLEGPMADLAVQHASSDEDAEEVIYHIDYHGVTTHPTPTPKHP